MKVLKRATLVPCLENEHREYVRPWCKENIIDDIYRIQSNYTEDGCFEVKIFNKNKKLNDSFLMMFMLVFPNTKIRNIEYYSISKVENDTYNSLFETA